MPSGSLHLIHSERGRIHALWHRGFVDTRDRPPARTGPHHCGQRGDRHQQAQKKAIGRRQAAAQVPRKMSPERWAVAEEWWRAGWSPEPIAGRYRPLGEGMAGKEWIYQSIRADRRAGGLLYRSLQRRRKKPNGRGGRDAGRGHIPGRVDMAERPAEVEARSRVGDWELEPIIGARHQGAWVSSVDRRSKDMVLERIDVKTAPAVTEAIVRRMRPFRDRVYTGTADHGQEFAKHREIAEALGADFHFATPDSS